VLSALLGSTRALAGAGCWLEMSDWLGGRAAVTATFAATLVGAIAVTPWVSQIVYRNSWREGVAVCAGLLLVISTPLGYVLLPGRAAAVPRHESP
jgi:hypothetical protein